MCSLELITTFVYHSVRNREGVAALKIVKNYNFLGKIFQSKGFQNLRNPPPKYVNMYVTAGVRGGFKGIRNEM